MVREALLLLFSQKLRSHEGVDIALFTNAYPTGTLSIHSIRSERYENTFKNVSLFISAMF